MSYCKKSGHVKENCFLNRAKSNVVAYVFELDACPVCNGSLHRFNVTLKDNSSKEIIGHRLLNCSQIYNADDNKKNIFLFQKIKSKFPNLCKIFT